MYSDRRLPANTPIADATISAADAARKTVYLLTALSAAKSMVASWVLSPSSAMNIAAKMVKNIFQSTVYTRFSENISLLNFDCLLISFTGVPTFLEVENFRYDRNKYLDHVRVEMFTCVFLQHRYRLFGVPYFFIGS